MKILLLFLHILALVAPFALTNQPQTVLLSKKSYSKDYADSKFISSVDTMNSIHIQREERIEGCCGIVLLLVLAFPPWKWHTFWFTACQDHPEKLLHPKAYWLLSSVEYNLWSHWHVGLSCLNFPRSSLLRCDSQEQTPLIISLPMVTGSNTVMTSSQLPFDIFLLAAWTNIFPNCLHAPCSPLLTCGQYFRGPHCTAELSNMEGMRA